MTMPKNHLEVIPLILLTALVSLLQSNFAFGQQNRQPAVDVKVEDLLRQMTLDEKIGQMTQVDMNGMKNKSDLQKYFIGSMLSGGGSDPADISAAGWAKAYDEYQSWALKTRLAIPLIYGIDAVHGHNNVDGAVIFPHNIGLGATRNAELVEKAARATAEEVAGTGMNWAFAPCIAVARDPRWGRTYESFGESAEVATSLGAAAIRGIQGKSLVDPTSVVACAKHFLGDGGTTGGKDQGNTSAMRRRCGRSICQAMQRQLKPTSAPSWCRTTVGTARKCTATSISLPTC